MVCPVAQALPPAEASVGQGEGAAVSPSRGGELQIGAPVLSEGTDRSPSVMGLGRPRAPEAGTQLCFAGLPGRQVGWVPLWCPGPASASCGRSWRHLGTSWLYGSSLGPGGEGLRREPSRPWWAGRRTAWAREAGHGLRGTAHQAQEPLGLASVLNGCGAGLGHAVPGTAGSGAVTLEGQTSSS